MVPTGKESEGLQGKVVGGGGPETQKLNQEDAADYDVNMIQKDIEALNMIIQENDLIPESHQALYRQ